MKITSIKGFSDILPGEVGAWQTSRSGGAAESLSAYNFAEIRIPIVEKTELFSRSIGETTDIVEKEMYTFEDRDSRSAEATERRSSRCDRKAPPGSCAPTSKRKCTRVEPVRKLYYMGPMFRRERPQKGRMRQFHQIGAEALGRGDPFIDAEILLLLNDFFRAVGLTEPSLQINSLGDSECRPQYREKLLAFLKAARGIVVRQLPAAHRSQSAARARLQGAGLHRGDPGRAVDSRFACAPIAGSISPTVQRLLQRNPCRVHAQSAHGARAGLLLPHDVRMDDHAARLAKRGGRRRALRRVGRATGRSGDSGRGFCDGRRAPDDACSGCKRARRPMARSCYIVWVGEKARDWAFPLVHRLRQKGIAVEMEGEARSLKSQMRRADKLKAASVLIVGDDELAKGKAVLRDMASKQQEEISLDRVEAELMARKAS